MSDLEIGSKTAIYYTIINDWDVFNKCKSWELTKQVHGMDELKTLLLNEMLDLVCGDTHS